MWHFLRWLSRLGAYLLAMAMTPAVCLVTVLMDLGIGKDWPPDSPQRIRLSELLGGCL